jgi:penicillin-binding protein 2
MPSGTPLISMFHARLLLLAAVIALGAVVLCGRLGELSIAQGAKLREEAESRLVTWDVLPTSRGRILDRKNRVLAQDRPSFDISVDYRVITGDWAITQAARAAKRANAGQWLKLSPEQRQEIVDQYIPIFQEHLDRMWGRIAEVGGTDLSRLELRRQDIIWRVEQRSESIFNMRLDRKLRERLAAGREITADTEEEIRKQIDRPIQDQKSPHVILSRVNDTIGFEFLRLKDTMVDLAIPTAGGGSEARTVPLLPGLTADNAGDREYPFDTVTVGVDLSTLPGPVATKEIRQITAKGVAYHILGRVLEGANADRKTDEGTTVGHRERRRWRLANEPAFANTVLTSSALAVLPRRIDRGEYRDNDLAGMGGIEESQEDRLRGLRGISVSQLETGENPKDDPIPGADVHLTLDIMLQARVQAAMSPELGLAVAQPWHGKDINPTVPIGTPLRGGAVVLDVDTGDILAMVSTPSISREALRENPASIFEDPWNTAVDLPWLDRSVGRPYPPGSIAKALVLTAAVQFGKLNLDVPIECTGFLFPNKPDQFRCWAFKQHHTTHSAVLGRPLSGPDALMVSCNIYFYTLGQRLGPEGIIRAYQMYGLGESFNLGLGSQHESVGFLGTRATRAGAIPASAARPGAVSPQDAIQMGIGQGPVAWTPLHAADSLATIGRQGMRIRPHLMLPEGTPEPLDLNLNPRAIADALEGLSHSVNQFDGTGHHVTFGEGEDRLPVPHFNAPGVQVWGKTGTAEAPTIRVKPGEQLYEYGVEEPALPAGERALRKGDHSWFVVLVGKQGENRPRYAISVMMEYAGSGGKVSGPIVNQIIYALIAEGYFS